MDAEAQRYLTDLTGTARAVLGGNLYGAYAVGSIGLGDYRPGRSDIDAALVVAAPLSLADKRDLVSRLRHEALPCPARGLELVVYDRAVAGSGTPEPGFEVELNTGPRMAFRATWSGDDRPAADGRFWYGLDRGIAHQSAYRLLGPPAAEVFADLSPEDLRSLLVDALEWWLARPEPGDDAVLGACRSLVKFRDGVWMSKVAAGRRLLDDRPSPLIEQAIRGVPTNGTGARAFQRAVLGEIAGGQPVG